MKIGENSFVSVSYTLRSGGDVVESVGADRPLEFIFGAGYLMPSFESHLAGLTVGDKFSFTLKPEEAYGEVIAEAIVELPKSIFMIDGVIEDGLLELGNQLPMTDNMGNRMLGTVMAVGEESVKMDFNHPMAGRTLDFEGEVVGIREATEEDFMRGQMASGGCGCGCGDCSDDCGCEEEGGCADEQGCNCNK